MKFEVCGFSGSGKSTFAKRLAQYYQIPILHMDTAHFKENWEENSKDIFEGKVLEFVNQPDWVIDGNYTNTVQQRFKDADISFYFAFNRFKCLYGAVKRYFKYRDKSRESIAKGCREKIDFQFVIWILYSGRTRDKKKKIRELIGQSKKFYIFRNRKQVGKYLASIGINGVK